MPLLLAGDIGGTKTHLGIFSREQGLRAPLAEADFSCAEFPNLAAIVRKFLNGNKLMADAACFGVAGPVRRGSSRVTNLPWVLDEMQLCRELNLKTVRLINDLEALACAVPLLTSSDLHTLNEGRPISKGNTAVIAPGTGLGEAFLTWDGMYYREHASEGGHADFAPNDALERELLSYLQEKIGHVSYESVCSGLGIINIYCFLRERCYAEEPSWLSDKLAREKDPVPVIAGVAVDNENTCDLCVMTLKLFVSILGAEAGNMALKVMATNGVYIGGGIPRRILTLLENEQFMKSFRHKGRMSDLVSQVPVYIITNPGAALLGAAHYGFKYCLNLTTT
jgi:glucokinase